MSAFKNAIRRKIHLERPTPKARQKFGILERHKDYKVRAKDHNRKKDTLRGLTEKASLRNPDEFYTKMITSKTQGGKHIVERKQHDHSHAALMVMKGQDINYLSHKLTTESKKIERIRGTLHGLSGQAQNEHHIFMSDPTDVKEFDAVEYFDTAPELVDRTFNRPRVEDLKNPNFIKGRIDPTTAKKLGEKRNKHYRELNARRKRKQEIQVVHDKLTLHKHLRGKGRREKVVFKDRFGDVDEEKTHFKWKMERRR